MRPSRDLFLDYLGVTNLIPGPNSTELAIQIGFARAGWPGLLVAGLCFIAPAALMVTAIGWMYVRYGGLPQVAGVVRVASRQGDGDPGLVEAGRVLQRRPQALEVLGDVVEGVDQHRQGQHRLARGRGVHCRDPVAVDPDGVRRRRRRIGGGEHVSAIELAHVS